MTDSSTPANPTGPRPVFIGDDVLFRVSKTGPTPENEDIVGVDRPAKVLELHDSDDPKVPRMVDLVVFYPRGSGCYVQRGVPESGKSPAAATIGDEPALWTWRWPGGYERSMPSGAR